jgi:anti-sigma-K factor RskA
VTADDNNDVLAAEYVLGTLDAEERAQAELTISLDATFAAAVHAWERRLGELSAMVDPKEPPADTFERIKSRVAGVEPAAFKLPEVAEAPKPAPEPIAVAAAPAALPAPIVVTERNEAEVVALSRRISRWRTVTLMTGALAACLVAFMVVRETDPDKLPVQLRPKPRIVEVTKTVEVPTTAPAEFVAVLQKDAFSPAFLLTLDLQKKTVTVRAVGAERQAGKSYELWLVSEKYATPQSLGLIGDQQFTVRQALDKYDAGTVNRATYAVSLEPEGGSKTGVPTGPVLYSGKLMQATPPAISQTP